MRINIFRVCAVYGVMGAMLWLAGCAAPALRPEAMVLKQAPALQSELAGKLKHSVRIENVTLTSDVAKQMIFPVAESDIRFALEGSLAIAGLLAEPSSAGGYQLDAKVLNFEYMEPRGLITYRSYIRYHLKDHAGGTVFDKTVSAVPELNNYIHYDAEYAADTADVQEADRKVARVLIMNGKAEFRIGEDRVRAKRVITLKRAPEDPIELERLARVVSLARGDSIRVAHNLVVMIVKNDLVKNRSGTVRLVASEKGDIYVVTQVGGIAKGMLKGSTRAEKSISLNIEKFLRLLNAGPGGPPDPESILHQVCDENEKLIVDSAGHIYAAHPRLCNNQMSNQCRRYLSTVTKKRESQMSEQEVRELRKNVASHCGNAYVACMTVMSRKLSCEVARKEYPWR